MRLRKIMPHTLSGKTFANREALLRLMLEVIDQYVEKF
jgi:hypothetical protein